MSDQSVISFSSTDLLNKYDPSKRVSEYLDLLQEENQRINLVSRETNTVGLISLYAESLIPLELFSGRKFDRYLDIGSGGGFPAVPIFLSGRVQAGTMVERIQKKATALQRMSVSLGLAVEIVPLSIEHIKQTVRYDLVTLRLVKLDKSILKSVERLLLPGSVFIYFSSTPLISASTSITKETYTYQIDSQNITKSLTIFKKSS